MAETAFKGTLLEGKERKYTVINERDVKKYSSEKWINKMNSSINNVLDDVEAGRTADGKEPFNNYIVINIDEPYVQEVIEIMKRYGHWNEKETTDEQENQLHFYATQEMIDRIESGRYEGTVFIEEHKPENSIAVSFDLDVYNVDRRREVEGAYWVRKDE